MPLARKYIQSIRSYFHARQAVDYVVIFGSAVKNLRPDSDIDVLVGGKLNFRQKVNAALSLEQKLGRTVDVVCIHEAESGLALEAFAKGIPVIVNDRRRLKQDYFRKLHEHEDNLPLRRIRAAKVKRDLAHG